MTTEINGCLKFNKSSWHYKLVIFVFGKYFFSTKDYVGGKWIEKSYDTSLCSYFWTVLFCSFIYPFKFTWDHLPYTITEHDVLCKAVLIWAFGSAGIHYWLIYGISIEGVSSDMWYLGFVIFFGGIAVSLTVVGILAVIFKVNDMIDKYQKKKAEEEDKPSKPSLLVEYVKARKSKVCPCIKFVEEKNNEDENKEGS